MWLRPSLLAGQSISPYHSRVNSQNPLVSASYPVLSQSVQAQSSSGQPDMLYSVGHQALLTMAQAFLKGLLSTALLSPTTRLHACLSSIDSAHETGAGWWWIQGLQQRVCVSKACCSVHFPITSHTLHCDQPLGCSKQMGQLSSANHSQLLSFLLIAHDN